MSLLHAINYILLKPYLRNKGPQFEKAFEQFRQYKQLPYGEKQTCVIS